MKEKLEQIKQEAKAGIQSFQSIIDIVDSLEEPEKYARITSAYWENGKIVVEFDTNVDIDIRYWFGEKVHEVEDYVGEIDQSKGIYRIGVNQFDKNWNVQLIGEVDSGVVNVGPFRKESEPISVNTLFGFYDGYRAPTEPVSLYKTDLSDEEGIEKAINEGKKLCLMISGFRKNSEGKITDYEIERRWKAQEPFLTDKIREAIAFVYVMDEPYHKGYDLKFQQKAIDVGRRIFGDFKYGYSYMEDHVMNKNKPLAINADFIGVNNYPFRDFDFAKGYNSDMYFVDSKESFFRFENELLSRIRTKVGDKDILLTTQGIYIDGQYNEPPKEAPFWWAELIQKNPKIKGVLVYNWKAKSNETKAVQDMNDYYINLQKAFPNKI